LISAYKRATNKEVVSQPSTSGNEFDLADKLTPIEQNFADGTGGRQMQPQFKGKSTMDLIISGDRTRTTRAKTDIQRMAKDYNLSKISDLVGKIIRMTDKTGRQVYTRITKVAQFTQEYQDATWQKEGWVKSVTDKHVGDYPYAIEFEVVKQSTTQPSTSVARGAETAITQDNKSYYRGQIEKPTIDKDGNLVLYAREDELYKRAGLKSKGVSMTDDLKSAIEYGNGQLEVAQNLASESYDANQELERLSQNGYYIIQIPKSISNEIVKEAGEVKVIGDKIIIPKGQYKIEQVVDGEEKITPQQDTSNVKPNVDFVFEQSPEMAIIGTQEQYSRYLDMVWPKSGVKQILFRGSQNPNKLEASDLDPEKGTGAKNLGKGIYLAKDKAFADKYSAPGGRTTAFIVNVPDFYITSIQKNWDRGYATPSDLTVREITGNTSDTLISFEGFDKDNYIDTDNRATGKYVGGLDENGFPVYQEMNMVTPQWTQMAVQSNAQILPLGSDQDKAQFQAFVLDENSPTKSLDSFTSVEDLQKNPTFENMTIEFVNEIKTNKDKPVAMRALKGQNKILMVSNLMYDKYTEKAWTKPATQADGSKATPLAENQFGTFNEFLTFALLHEKAHTYILKTKNENTGEYEDRINNEAQRRLDEIPNKEVKNERVVAPEQVVVTDEMIQDFMFNVCK
jgi:hypothetical protein